MKRYELENKEYKNNVKELNKFFNSIKLINVEKVIGFNDTTGRNAEWKLVKGEEEYLNELKADIIDSIATFGGYVYCYKEGKEEGIKELELN